MRSAPSPMPEDAERSFFPSDFPSNFLEAREKTRHLRPRRSTKAPGPLQPAAFPSRPPSARTGLPLQAARPPSIPVSRPEKHAAHRSRSTRQPHAVTGRAAEETPAAFRRCPGSGTAEGSSHAARTPRPASAPDRTCRAPDRRKQQPPPDKARSVSPIPRHDAALPAGNAPEAEPPLPRHRRDCPHSGPHAGPP